MAEATDAMGWHRVCLNTIVRKEKVLDSERLRILPMGSRVNVVEKSGRRVRIDQPIVGWCSLQSSNGDTILKPLDPNQQKQTVAATPRSGQAAVTNLQSKLKATDEQIDQAQKGQNSEALTTLKAEKQQLEARIDDLVRQNEHQQKVLQDWKAAAESNTATAGTVPTDIQNVQFRNGDAVLLDKQNSNMEGIVIVRCVAKDSTGKDLIGCDYQAESPELFAKEHPDQVTDGTLDGEHKWTPAKEMVGVWLTREDMKTLLPALKILEQLQEMEAENNDLLYYKRTAKAMIKLVKEFSKEFHNLDNVGKVKGPDFAKAFTNAFTMIDVVEG